MFIDLHSFIKIDPHAGRFVGSSLVAESQASQVSGGTRKTRCCLSYVCARLGAESRGR